MSLKQHQFYEDIQFILACLNEAGFPTHPDPHTINEPHQEDNEEARTVRVYIEDAILIGVVIRPDGDLLRLEQITILPQFDKSWFQSWINSVMSYMPNYNDLMKSDKRTKREFAPPMTRNALAQQLVMFCKMVKKKVKYTAYIIDDGSALIPVIRWAVDSHRMMKQGAKYISLMLDTLPEKAQAISTNPEKASILCYQVRSIGLVINLNPKLGYISNLAITCSMPRNAAAVRRIQMLYKDIDNCKTLPNNIANITASETRSGLLVASLQLQFQHNWKEEQDSDSSFKIETIKQYWPIIKRLEFYKTLVTLYMQAIHNGGRLQ